MTQTIIIIIVVLAIVMVVGVFIKAKSPKLSPKDQQFFKEHWDMIQKKSNSDFNHAILDADKLLDKVLTKKGYQGSLGEKLKKANNLFSDTNGLWSAHKLRNLVAHELNFMLTEKQTQQALSQFKKALKDLGIDL